MILRGEMRSCTLMPLLALHQCDSLRSYSCLRGANLQSFLTYTYTIQKIPKTTKMLAENWELRGKSVELNTSRAVAARQPQWLEFQEQNPTPFPQKYMWFSFIPFLFFLKDLAIGKLEARIVNIMLCGWESVWRW